MSDRRVRVILEAIAGPFVQGMREGEAAAKKAADATETIGAKSKVTAAQFSTLGNTAGVAGLAIGAGLAFGVKSFADFDQAMSAVRAALPDATDKMDALRQLAIQLGADTQFSATEAAQGITELGKAGVSAGDILGGGLKGALDLAAAGQLGVADASEIAATALTQFGLSGRDVSHVADLYAAAAGKAQGSVKDISEAMKFVGPVAKSMGLSIEETTGVIGEFAHAGIIGEQAGTGLRGVLLSLVAPSVTAKDTLHEYGVVLYDSQGKVKSLAGIAEELRTKLGGLDAATRNQALGQIFGNAQITAGITLMEGGGAAVTDWTDKVNDSGFAAKQAATLTDNWRGDIERLGGSLDSVFVKNGSTVNAALRSITKNAESAVNAFGNMPAGLQATVFGLAGLTTAALLAAFVGAKVFSTYTEVSAALNAVALSSPRAAAGLTAVGTATRLLIPVGLVVGIAAVSLGIRDMIEASTVADVKVKDLASSLHELSGGGELTGGIADLFREQGAKISIFGRQIGQQKEQYVSAGEAAQRFAEMTKNSLSSGFWADIKHGFGEGGAGAGSFNKTIKELDGGLAQLVQDGHADEAAAALQALTKNLSPEEVTKVTERLTGYNTALAATSGASSDAAGASGDAAAGMDQIQQAADDAAKANEDLVKSLQNLGSTVLAQRDAMRGLEASIDSATAAAKENGKTSINNGKALEINTAKGRANQAALDAIADSTAKATAQTYQLTGSADKAAAVTDKGRKAFIASAVQMGLGTVAAGKLADQLGLIPDNVRSDIALSGVDQARAKAQGLGADLASLHDKTVYIKTVWSAIYTSQAAKNQAEMQNKWSGGPVSFNGGGPTGPGGVFEPKGVVHGGEFVHTQRQLSKPGMLGFHSDLWRTDDLDQAYARYKMRGFAGGGPVGMGNGSLQTVRVVLPQQAPTRSNRRGVDVNVSGFTSREMIQEVVRGVMSEIRFSDALIPG